MSLPAIRDFLKSEAAAGVMLILASVVALLWANSPAAPLYERLFDTTIALEIGHFSLRKPFLLWINDGLMAVFFLLVGLEIKREAMVGELSNPAKALLPGVAALGGMAAPAATYLAITGGDPALANGWAIPAATDIAFAVGVLALLGSRVPSALRVFLLALAIIDDLGAIVIIALFYTADLTLSALAVALAAVAGLFALNRAGVQRVWPYLAVGVVLWVGVLKSGVHATLAGVILAMAIPIRNPQARDEEDTPLHHLEHGLHRWVAFLIIPLFALANAGVSLKGVSVETLLAPLPLGIALGLLLGKQVGVFSAVLLGWKWLRCELPPGASIAQLYGMAVLTGIGFTMSLFIGTLAFPEPTHAAAIRIGVLGGSLLSAVAGYSLLRAASRRENGFS